MRLKQAPPNDGAGASATRASKSGVVVPPLSLRPSAAAAVAAEPFTVRTTDDESRSPRSVDHEAARNATAVPRPPLSGASVQTLLGILGLQGMQLESGGVRNESSVTSRSHRMSDSGLSVVTGPGRGTPPLTQLIHGRASPYPASSINSRHSGGSASLVVGTGSPPGSTAAAASLSYHHHSPSVASFVSGSSSASTPSTRLSGISYRPNSPSAIAAAASAVAGGGGGGGGGSPYYHSGNSYPHFDAHASNGGSRGLLVASLSSSAFGFGSAGGANVGRQTSSLNASYIHSENGGAPSSASFSPSGGNCSYVPSPIASSIWSIDANTSRSETGSKKHNNLVPYASQSSISSSNSCSSSISASQAALTRIRQPDCKCSADDTFESLSLLFLACCRPTYSLLAQCVVFSLLVFIYRDPAAWITSARYWSVWVTAADLASLGSIALALRSEGAPLKAVVYPPESLGAPLHKEVTLAIGYYAMLYAASALGDAGASLLVYGQLSSRNDSGGAPETLSVHAQSEIGAAVSILVFPLLFSLGAICTYVSLLFPRAERLFGSWFATGAVALAWAAQYAFLPLYLDAPFVAYRFLSSLPLAAASVNAFRANRRVLPLLIAHWALALVAACSSAAKGWGLAAGGIVR